MLFRFIGRYTNGHTSINASGVIFEGNEPAEVTDPEAIRRLTGHPEFDLLGRVALTGKNKTELLAIAEDEGVEVPEGATNKQIVAAIEAAREGTE